MNINTFEELEDYLESWVNFKSDESYDFVGLLSLMTAILRNIHKNALEVDFDVLEDYFEEEEKKVLNKIMKHM